MYLILKIGNIYILMLIYNKLIKLINSMISNLQDQDKKVASLSRDHPKCHLYQGVTLTIPLS